jgi:hypothetical protein
LRSIGSHHQGRKEGRKKLHQELLIMYCIDHIVLIEHNHVQRLSINVASGR